jgi:hypothetical protein
MKAKHAFLAIAALLAAGGFWFAGSDWHTHRSQKSSLGDGLETTSGAKLHPDSAASLAKVSQARPAAGPDNQPQPGKVNSAAPRLAPPVPNRRFTDFTPEQRVQFARQGHGPGG